MIAYKFYEKLDTGEKFSSILKNRVDGSVNLKIK